MPDLRRDSVTGRLVAVASERGRRPNEFAGKAPLGASRNCPFCRGKEAETPPEIALYESGGKGDWQVRVVPNKYPAFIDGDTTSGEVLDGFHSQSPAAGAHEVIIESPDHCEIFAELTNEQAGLVFRAYRDRFRAHAGGGKYAHALLFKNVGEAAGASIEHLHSQLIATPFVPPAVERELCGAAEYMQTHGRCVWCASIEREIEQAERVVLETSGFVAMCPFVSRFAYEVWIVPKLHGAHFAAIGDAELQELASAARELSVRLESVAERATSNRLACNWVLLTAPFDADENAFHWRLELLPRTAKIAGCEIGGGCFINTVSPEAAAETLSRATT